MALVVQARFENFKLLSPLGILYLSIMIHLLLYANVYFNGNFYVCMLYNI